MIDTHAHLDGEAFDEDRLEILDRAFQGGVEQIIIPAIEPENFRRVLDLAASDERIFCGMGVHPHHALEVNESVLEKVEMLSKEKKVVAIGEIGLDYYYDFAPKDVQQDVFRKQLKIAKKGSLPVIVHNRESDDDLMTILKDEQDGNLNGVLHCFSGNVGMMKEAVDLGFYISFTGNITFKKSTLAEVVKETPIDKIMIETDSPYMTPVPHRGKRNEPALVRLVAEKIAEIKLLSINEVISMTTQNAKRLFRLLILLLTFSVAPIIYAQPAEEATSDSSYHPFEKGIGFGPFAGVNTIVQSNTRLSTNETRDVSYEGIPLFGGTISYSPLDFLILETDYVYSLNKREKDRIVDPLHHVGENVHQILQLRSIWLVNPYSVVNFFGSIGGSYIFNHLNKGAVDIQTGQPWDTKETAYAINGSLGFNINIKFKNWGLVNIRAEWLLEFDLSERKFDEEEIIYKPGTSEIQEVKYNPSAQTTFFSMPRLCLLWYPPFINKQK